MTTDFAELKEKLTSFDSDDTTLNKMIKDENYAWAAYDKMSHIEKVEAHDALLDIASYQHAKSAAIISELIDIIKSQSEALKFYASDSSWNSAGAFFYNRIDSIDESTIEGLDRNTYFGGKTSRQALSETNTRLQKLRENK